MNVKKDNFKKHQNYLKIFKTKYQMSDFTYKISFSLYNKRMSSSLNIMNTKNNILFIRRMKECKEFAIKIERNFILILY